MWSSRNTVNENKVSLLAVPQETKSTAHVTEVVSVWSQWAFRLNVLDRGCPICLARTVQKEVSHTTQFNMPLIAPCLDNFTTDSHPAPLFGQVCTQMPHSAFLCRTDVDLFESRVNKVLSPQVQVYLLLLNRYGCKQRGGC